MKADEQNRCHRVNKMNDEFKINIYSYDGWPYICRPLMQVNYKNPQTNRPTDQENRQPTKIE